MPSRICSIRERNEGADCTPGSCGYTITDRAMKKKKTASVLRRLSLDFLQHFAVLHLDRKRNGKIQQAIQFIELIGSESRNRSGAIANRLDHFRRRGEQLQPCLPRFGGLR